MTTMNEPREGRTSPAGQDGDEGSRSLMRRVLASSDITNVINIVSGDLNGDGKTDLVTANGAGTISVLLGNGNGVFRGKKPEFHPPPHPEG